MPHLRRSLWLALIVSIGVAVLVSSTAGADEDAEPRRVKKKVKIREAPGGEAGRDPMATARRWVRKEMARHMKAMGEAEGEAARSPLHYWFATKDVPMAGLRDALEADGWTADELMAWMQRHFMHAMLQGIGPMMGLLEADPTIRNRMGGPWRGRGRGLRYHRGPWRGMGAFEGYVPGRRRAIARDGEAWRTGRRTRTRGPESGPGSGKAQIQRLIDLLRRLQQEDGRTAPGPAAPRPPDAVPPRGRRRGMPAPVGPHGAEPQELDAMLRRLREMLEALPPRGGETDMAGGQLDALMEQLLRMLEPAGAPKRKKAKNAARKLESVGYRVRSRADEAKKER